MFETGQAGKTEKRGTTGSHVAWILGLGRKSSMNVQQADCRPCLSLSQAKTNEAYVFNNGSAVRKKQDWDHFEQPRAMPKENKTTAISA